MNSLHFMQILQSLSVRTLESRPLARKSSSSQRPPCRCPGQQEQILHSTLSSECRTITKAQSLKVWLGLWRKLPLAREAGIAQLHAVHPPQVRWRNPVHAVRNGAQRRHHARIVRLQISERIEVRSELLRRCLHRARGIVSTRCKSSCTCRAPAYMALLTHNTRKERLT
jgi:hypothetical protein